MNALLNQFNHLNLANQPANWNYQALFIEVLNNGADQNAVLVCSRILLIIGNIFGQYGKVNVGNGGAAYTMIRTQLLDARNGLLALNIPGNANNAVYPILRDYLTEPVTGLPIYGGSGPGGQGNYTINLNSCIKMVLERIHTIMGAIKLKDVLSIGNNHWNDIQ